MTHSLLEVGLHSPVWPLVLSRLLVVLFKEGTSVIGSGATFLFPALSTASPMGLPKLLIKAYSSHSRRHILPRITEVPLARMAFASSFVVVKMFVSLLA